MQDYVFEGYEGKLSQRRKAKLRKKHLSVATLKTLLRHAIEKRETYAELSKRFGVKPSLINNLLQNERRGRCSVDMLA